MPDLRDPVNSKARWSLAAAAFALLSACATGPSVDGIYDPFEVRNREMHQANKNFDSSVVGPSAGGYGAVPDPLRDGVNNFADNITLPGKIVNSLLQLNLEATVQNSFRLLLNSTVGIGGLFDPADALQLYEHDTGFSETMYVWGVGEGAFLELPVLGASTQRDAVGSFVDLVANPAWYILGPTVTAVGLGSMVASKFDSRQRYSNTVESILYDSEDSYAQSRLIYLQNRRFELGVELGEGEDSFDDPFDEMYGE